MSSPGSGKTTTLVRTINELKNKIRFGVMEADIDGDCDAYTIADKTGAKVNQLHTGGMCHLDSEMTRQGLDNLGLDDVDCVFLENIGNLVCPAEFDTGASKKIAILSIPEGDDKPLKYPLMFSVCDVVLINKIDALPVFDFDINKCIENIHKLNPNCEVFPISSKTGEGFNPWLNWLEKNVKEWIK
jgi:hydrogenase nickel incorporation protein HypB